MRIPPLLVSCLLLANSSLSAQGLEYRVRMHMTIPGIPDGMPGGMPTPETTMFMEGTKIRVDNSSRDMSMSIIMDGATRRMFYLNHTDKTFREEERSSFLPDSLAPSDTATMRAMGMIPDIITTTETRTILGYPTKRFVMVMRIPVPAEPGTVMLSVNESWISTDPRLRDAFKASMEVAERMLGPAAKDLKALTPPGADGVPLETNIVMMKRKATDKIDALALLKEANPEGLMTRARMETLSVKAHDIPDSVFAVPAGYRKAN